ncbi:MAG: heavy metal translocating P-type ATPase [Parachlamydiales bacterium]|nr:heavy metal translocating P-type ATPase [Parachlamydiales bacterium]
MAKEQMVFRVNGMDCSEEVIALKKTLGHLLSNDEDLVFDLMNQKLTILYSDQEKVTFEEVMKGIHKAGLTAEPWQDNPFPLSFWQHWQKPLIALISGLFLLIGGLFQALSHKSVGDAVAAMHGDAQALPSTAIVFYLLAIFVGCWNIMPKAFSALRSLRPDMNLLMTIAVLGAIAINQWFEAATVTFLFTLSLALESWSVGRARKAIASLMSVSSMSARIIKDGEEHIVAPADVPLNSIVRVFPGEMIPIDGIINAGSSQINQAPITGESMPVTKSKGEIVFAGTLNGSGSLDIMCNKASKDTTFATIVRVVEQAQEKRSVSEQWVEKFARIYTPVVILIALGILIIPPFLYQMPWQESFYRALVMLVIACPCALVISTPVSIVAALTASAKHGVLVKGGRFLEEAARLQAIAFDKTGTLTKGAPEVVRMICNEGHTEEELLERAMALESHSDHPLAKAIVAYAKQRGIKAEVAENFRIIEGKGAVGTFKGKTFWLGSHRYIEERGQETLEMHQRLQSLAAHGSTVVAIGNDEHVCGFIALADEVKANAKGCIDELKNLGITKIAMLTGDNRETALSIATKTGIVDVYSELLPEDKVSVIEKMIEKMGHVAMVGDGINDAPSMATATLGIAMGSMGSDVAIETADVALMSDDLSKLPWLLRHARQTLKTIRQNIVFALSIKAVVMLLNFLGYTSLWSAILADTGATLIVVANSLRLLKPKQF